MRMLSAWRRWDRAERNSEEDCAVRDCLRAVSYSHEILEEVTGSEERQEDNVNRARMAKMGILGMMGMMGRMGGLNCLLYYNEAYSEVASNEGHALAAKSECECIEASGKRLRRTRSKLIRDTRCASVRVSRGVLPSGAVPPI